MVLTIKVMMVVFGSIDLFRGIGATKVVQDLPKINASLYESPTLSKLEFPIQEKMHIALLQSILCYRIRQRHTERKYARLRRKQNQRSVGGIFSISRQESEFRLSYSIKHIETRREFLTSVKYPSINYLQFQTS